MFNCRGRTSRLLDPTLGFPSYRQVSSLAARPARLPASVGVLARADVVFASRASTPRTCRSGGKRLRYVGRQTVGLVASPIGPARSWSHAYRTEGEARKVYEACIKRDAQLDQWPKYHRCREWRPGQPEARRADARQGQGSPTPRLSASRSPPSLSPFCLGSSKPPSPGVREIHKYRAGVVAAFVSWPSRPYGICGLDGSDAAH